MAGVKELFNQTLIESPTELDPLDRVAVGQPSVAGGKNIKFPYLRELTHKVKLLSYSPTGTTETILLGSDVNVFITLDVSGASGDVTLTISDPAPAGTYLYKVIQGVTSRDIIFPVGTTQLSEPGNTVLGIASGTQYITTFFDGSNHVIIGNGLAV